MKRILIQVILSLIILFSLIGFCYAYPRFLASKLGEDSPWISYLYTYGMGLIVFIGSLAFILTRQIDALRRKQELYWTTAIVCGFLVTFSCHGIWIYFSVRFPLAP